MKTSPARIELVSAFKSLDRRLADEKGRLAAQPIQQREGYWIAVDHDAAPALLIEDPRESAVPANIEFRNLRVLFAALCELNAGGRITRGRYTVVSCRTSDPELVGHFLRICGGLLDWLPSRPGPTEVRRLVDQLSELFRALELPSLKSLQGLWGELLLIGLSSGPEMLLRAWHNASSERFDFANGRQRVEVKTAGANSRLHHFRLEQVRSELVDVCVASIQVEAVGAGASIDDLVTVCETRLAGDADAHLKLMRLVGSILGRDWRAAQKERFDIRLALNSLQFVNAKDVPAVSLPLPPKVSEVSFMADITAVPNMENAALAAADGLWKAALPDRAMRQAIIGEA